MTDKAKLDNERQLAAAMKRFTAIQRSKCFDPYDLDSRPVGAQDQVLHEIGKYAHRYVIGGNQSGKSMTGGREAAWVFTETHPHWERPEEWGKMPLMMLVVGRTSTQVEEELWNKKIKPFLDPQDYREVRQGGSLQKVIHRKTKNTILFFSHHSPEEAREKIQSYTAHWLWLDEMPNSFKLLEELHRRCQAYRGRFLATFTPKLRNNEIRLLVDSVNPYQQKYRLGMLDNPIYKGREEEVLAPLANLPEGYRKTILEGEWWVGDTAVYQFDTARHTKPLPPTYFPGWRHIEAIDPAASGKAGYVLLAEDPATNVWHVIKATYFNGASAKGLLAEVAKQSQSVNIIKRVSDPHETWFIKHAQEEGFTFVGVWKKSERKKELIKNLQIALDTGRMVVSPWLTDLVNEFTSCQWSETVADKIVGSKRFHILDSLQYALDNIPKATKEVIPQTHNQYLKQANKERKIKEAQKLAKNSSGRSAKGRIGARRGKRLKRA